MKTSHKWAMFLIGAGLAACTSETIVEEPAIVEGSSSATIKEITVTLPEIQNDADTRTQFVVENNGIKAYWAENDTLGIFPAKGDQVSFPVNGGSNSSTCTFDGGDWGLKAGRNYAAYFPFDKWNIFRNNETIQMDYSGQVQTGDNTLDHLSDYDFLATGQVSPNAAGYLSLEMQRLGCIVFLELTVPTAGEYTEVEVLINEPLFAIKRELDISGSSPVIKDLATSNKMTLGLNNLVTTAANQTVKLFMMFPPVDLTGKTMSVVMKRKDNVRFSGTLNPVKDQILNANSVRKFTSTLQSSGGGIHPTSIELWNPDGSNEIQNLTFSPIIQQGNTFGPNGEVTFVDGRSISSSAYAIVRVVPADVVLTSDMISLINSHGEDINDQVRATGLTTYEGIVTRGTDTGLWIVKFNLNNYDEENFSEIMGYWSDSGYHHVLYALSVSYYDNNTGTERNVTSDFKVSLDIDYPEPASELNYTVNNTSVTNINNRYSKYSISLPEIVIDDLTYYKELKWKESTAAIPTPATTVVWNGKVNVEQDSADDRSNKYMPVVTQGQAMTIKLQTSSGPSGVYAFYVALDEVNAVVPGELEAWRSYRYTGLNTITYGDTLKLTIDADETISDIIGFRVYAVNWDGTLVDPDGKAFYVNVLQ